MQIHKELVQSQNKISEALHQKFLAMLLAMEDVPAVLIVLADHLHLMRTQPTRDAAQDTLDVFAPLANRLGVWSIKAELEDLSFKVTPRQLALQPAVNPEADGMDRLAWSDSSTAIHRLCIKDAPPSAWRATVHWAHADARLPGAA